MNRLMYLAKLFCIVNFICIGTVSAKPIVVIACLMDGLNDLRDERQVAVQIWVEELSRNSAIQFDTLPVNTLAELLTLIQTQKVDFVLLNSYYFLQAQHALTEQIGQDIWAIKRAKDLFESFVMFTRQDFKFTNFASLRHHSLSLRGDYLLMNQYLRFLTYQSAKLEAEQFFKKFQFTNTASKPVLDVYFSTAEVGMTPKFAYELALSLNPNMSRELKIIHESPAQFIPALVLSFKHTAVETQAVFRKSIQEIQNNPRGQQIIEIFKINAIQAISLQELQPLMAFYQQATLNRAHAR